jgi:hypothetical protein
VAIVEGGFNVLLPGELVSSRIVRAIHNDGFGVGLDGGSQELHI